MRRTSGERDKSTVNVWCHFAVRGNSGVSNIGTHISAGKHLFNSHPFPRPRLSKSCPNDFNPPVPSPFFSFNCPAFIRRFARTCLWTRDDWQNAIRLKVVHRVPTDVVVPINGLKAILFPTCMCMRPFQSWSIAVKMKVVMYATTSRITLYATRKIDWFWFKVDSKF